MKVTYLCVCQFPPDNYKIRKWNSGFKKNILVLTSLNKLNFNGGNSIISFGEGEYGYPAGRETKQMLHKYAICKIVITKVTGPYLITSYI